MADILKTVITRPPRVADSSGEVTFPAPHGGENSRDSLAAMEPRFARALVNLEPQPGYVELRRGNRFHAGISTEHGAITDATAPTNIAAIPRLVVEAGGTGELNLRDFFFDSSGVLRFSLAELSTAPDWVELTQAGQFSATPPTPDSADAVSWEIPCAVTDAAGNGPTTFTVHLTALPLTGELEAPGLAFPGTDASGRLLRDPGDALSPSAAAGRFTIQLARVAGAGSYELQVALPSGGPWAPLYSTGVHGHTLSYIFLGAGWRIRARAVPDPEDTHRTASQWAEWAIEDQIDYVADSDGVPLATPDPPDVRRLTFRSPFVFATFEGTEEVGDRGQGTVPGAFYLIYVVDPSGVNAPRVLYGTQSRLVPNLVNESAIALALRAVPDPADPPPDRAASGLSDAVYVVASNQRLLPPPAIEATRQANADGVAAAGPDVVLDWAPVREATSYEVQLLEPGEDGAWTAASGSPHQPPTGATAVNFTVRADVNGYRCRVRSIPDNPLGGGSDGSWLPSLWSHGEEGFALPDRVVPAIVLAAPQPTPTRLNSGMDATVRLTWADVENAGSFQIQTRASASAAWVDDDDSPVMHPTAETFSVSVEAPADGYEARIRALPAADSATHAASPWTVVALPDLIPAPTPDQLQAPVVEIERPEGGQSAGVILRWSGVENAVDYLVQSRADASAAWADRLSVGQVPAGGQASLTTAAPEGTQFRIRARAQSSSFTDSEWSNVVTAPAVIPAPPEPEALPAPTVGTIDRVVSLTNVLPDPRSRFLRIPLNLPASGLDRVVLQFRIDDDDEDRSRFPEFQASPGAANPQGYRFTGNNLIVDTTEIAAQTPHASDGDTIDQLRWAEYHADATDPLTLNSARAQLNLDIPARDVVLGPPSQISGDRTPANADVVQISWSAVPAATSYTVQRRQRSGAWEAVAEELDALSIASTMRGTGWEVRVRGNAAGLTSEWSAAVAMPDQVPVQLAAPQNVMATRPQPALSGVTVTWGAVPSTVIFRVLPAQNGVDDTSRQTFVLGSLQSAVLDLPGADWTVRVQSQASGFDYRTSEFSAPVAVPNQAGKQVRMPNVGIIYSPFSVPPFVNQYDGSVVGRNRDVQIAAESSSTSPLPVAFSGGRLRASYYYHFIVSNYPDDLRLDGIRTLRWQIDNPDGTPFRTGSVTIENLNPQVLTDNDGFSKFVRLDGLRQFIRDEPGFALSNADSSQRGTFRWLSADVEDGYIPNDPSEPIPLPRATRNGFLDYTTSTFVTFENLRIMAGFARISQGYRYHHRADAGRVVPFGSSFSAPGDSNIRVAWWNGRYISPTDPHRDIRTGGSGLAPRNINPRAPSVPPHCVVNVRMTGVSQYVAAEATLPGLEPLRISNLVAERAENRVRSDRVPRPDDYARNERFEFRFSVSLLSGLTTFAYLKENQDRADIVRQEANLTGDKLAWIQVQVSADNGVTWTDSTWDDGHLASQVVNGVYDPNLRHRVRVRLKGNPRYVVDVLDPARPAPTRNGERITGNIAEDDFLAVVFPDGDWIEAEVPPHVLTPI